MKTFRKRQIWKACKMSPTGKSNFIKKCYSKFIGPSWFSLTYMAVDLLWDDYMKGRDEND